MNRSLDLDKRISANKLLRLSRNPLAASASVALPEIMIPPSTVPMLLFRVFDAGANVRQCQVQHVERPCGYRRRIAGARRKRPDREILGQ